ncbi:MAG TPA: hypothetical protein PKJ94_07280 [Ferruginibacter sp.]|nr:hypothetical protein [Ferruginibacter sp.]
MSGHTEPHYGGVADGKQKITKITVHCHCNDFVSTSPFIYQADEILFGLPSFLTVLRVQFHSELSSAPHFHFKYRGPPTLA